MEELKFKLGKFVDKDVSLEKVNADYHDYVFKPDCHFLISGESRSGKTFLLKDIVEEAILAGCPCLVIDSKGDLARLACPYGAAVFARFQNSGHVDYLDHYRRFGVVDRQKEYDRKVAAVLLDYNYSPTKNDMKWVFTRRDGLTPLTIVSLHLADREHPGRSKEKREGAVLRILDSIISALSDLKRIPETKFLFIDEAHRFSSKESPELNNRLEIILREICGEAKIIVGLSTQSKSDYSEDYLREHKFTHVFQFFDPKREKYKCRILYFSGQYQVRDWDRQDTTKDLLFPRWTFTIDGGAIERQQFNDINEILRMKVHYPIITRFSPPMKRDLITDLKETDFKILSCVNDMPLSHTWNSQAIQKLVYLPKEENLESIVNRLQSIIESRGLHYHTWLDYGKLGFPITAFFVAVGKNNWRDKLQDVIKLPEIVESYEIECENPYFNVNLLFKLRVRDMESYNDFVCSKLLTICKRGMTEKERFEKCHDQFLQEYKSEHGEHALSMPNKLPREQIVSGCICAKTFSDHPACFIQDDALDFLDDKNQIQVLNGVREVEGSSLFSQTDGPVQLDLEGLSKGIIKLCEGENLNTSYVVERIRHMAEMGIIKGIYFELPWQQMETTFVLGQLKFENVIDQADKVSKQLQLGVQEVHTIAGTYDILVKLRGKQEMNKIETQLSLSDSLVLDVKNPLKPNSFGPA